MDKPQGGAPNQKQLVFLLLCLDNAKPSNVCVSLTVLPNILFPCPTDKSMDGDFSPKPTIFLPSIAETTLHKAGTYLCLLENFFPDAIQVYWKEKNSDKVLESQQGNTMKIKDTYMKFSWLTVPQKSFSKEHRCIVKHETKAGGRDQEILFPAIQKGMWKTHLQGMPYLIFKFQ